MIQSNQPLPYAIEYAVSSRSCCKKCKKVINLKNLRMSLNQPADFFDGKIDSWFHYECFWQNMNRGRDSINISSIRGVDWLRWEDQEDLRLRVQNYNSLTAASYSTKPSNSLSFSSVKITQSLTNRGKCSKCSQNYEKGEIKVYKKCKQVHLKCFLEDFDNFVGTLDDVPDWATFDDRWRNQAIADLAAIKQTKDTCERKEDTEGKMQHDGEVALDPEVLPEVSGYSIKKKRAAVDDITAMENNTDESSMESEFAKKRRIAKEAKLVELRKKRVKKQADRLWELRQMFENMKISDRLAILSDNDQDIPEGHDNIAKVIERLADNALFGCPIVCSKCPNGKIVFDSSRRTYVCTGYATEYSKCTYESKNPIRTPFKVPLHFIEKYHLEDVIFNEMSERYYIGEETNEEVIKMEKRKSKGGVHGDQFIYAAETFDSINRVRTMNEAKVSNTHIIKNGTIVDCKFAHAEQCHVLRNKTDGTLYQATLSFTDLTQNKNSYYKIQLLKDDTREYYYVFRAWGRVGTDVGDYLFQQFYDSISAIKKFQEIFQEKTKNEWKYRKHFRKMPGMFNYVETDYSELAGFRDNYIIPGSKSALPQPVKEVVLSIFDVENMKSALKSFEMDVNKMPLGRLSRKQINIAFNVLNDLSDLLIHVPVNSERILDCSNKFYTIIPHNFGMKVPEPIDSFHKIKEKNNMLNALLDIKFAYDQVCGENSEATSSVGIDPVDVNYQKLKCAMEPLERGCKDWKIIDEYIKNTQGSTHDLKVDLIDILKVNRNGESDRFKEYLGNRRLLWHGSGKMNFAGILGQGLRIAPPEAPVSGYMFGKGVYFADMFSKSAFYCRANGNEEAYLLLCDVALGEMFHLMNATHISKNTLPKGTHSVKGIGCECPHESGNYNHPDGYMIPKGGSYHQLSGRRGHDYQLLYNEYIVYDVDQIQLKYLVRVKMHHARHIS